MRHRRRLSTQINRKKRPVAATQQMYPADKKSGFWAGFFKVLFYLIIIAALGAVVYTQVLPRYLNSSKAPANLSSEAAQTRTPDKPRLPVEQKQPDKPTLSPIQKKIQVEVLNGCGENGIAKILGDALRRKNYDIVNSGNYIKKGKVDFDVKNTFLIDQLKTSENLTRTRHLADILGISLQKIESFENPAPIADITIVVGNDYKKLAIFKH